MDTKHAAAAAPTAATAAAPAVHVVAAPLAGGDPIAPHWQPVKIAKFLYLGSYKNATDIATIKKLGITGIICCAPEHMQVVKDFGRHTLTKERKARSAAINMDYLFLHWDAKRPPVHTVFEDVNRALHFIEQQAARGGKVLIHCHLGTDRAARLDLRRRTGASAACQGPWSTRPSGSQTRSCASSEKKGLGRGKKKNNNNRQNQHGRPQDC